MDKLLLRGYVTPEDFGGDVQKALDMAESLDIRKVILEKDYTCGTLTVPAMTHLIIRGTLTARLESKKCTGYSFEQDRFYIEGGTLVGDAWFYNCRRAVLDHLRVEGNVTFEYCRDLRLEYCTVTGALQLGKGCTNSILQHLTLGSAAISQKVFCGDIVPSKDPTIQSIVLRDSTLTDGPLQLVADEDWGLMNIQADHLTAPEAAVVVGEENVALPPERYMNLTLDALTAPQPVVLRNPTLHAYIR